MARVLLMDPQEGIFQFPKSRRKEAFGAAELIAERLAMPIQVVKRRDPETHVPIWALAINPEGRGLTPEEIESALKICRMVLT